MKETEYRRLADRMLAATEGDERIAALLVYGSHAAGRADAFSDVDFGVVATDAGYDAVVAGADAMVRALGVPLFVEHFGNPARLHVILADGIELELIIDRESELRLEGPHVSLFDRSGVIERARGRGEPPTDPPDASDVRRRITWFWHDIGHLITALGRRNTWWAYGQLDELRRACLNLARLEAGLPAEDEAYWKLDEAIPEKRLAALAATTAAPEFAPMKDAALAVVDLYRDLATGLATAHGVAYPTELDRLLTARLRGLA
ncbi:MAG: aminoglycoside 6-adenylyltransferase [Candidatus Limnocylindria bacterium]